MLTIAMIAMSIFSTSFDCSKASTLSEKLVCQNDQLSKLDDEVFTLYKQAMKDGQNKAEIKSAQRLWAKSLRSCTNANCLEQLYSYRIIALNATISPAQSSTPSTTYTTTQNSATNTQVISQTQNSAPSSITNTPIPANTTVETEDNPSWLSKHYWSIIGAIVVASIIGLLTMIGKNKNNSTAYIHNGENRNAEEEKKPINTEKNINQEYANNQPEQQTNKREKHMRYEINGLAFKFTDLILIMVGVILIAFYGLGILVIIGVYIYASKYRKIIIDTREDSLSGPGWSVKLSEVEDIHTEEIWTHSAKSGSSRANYVTIVGDFGSKRITFWNKDKMHEFLDRMKKATA